MYLIGGTNESIRSFSNTDLQTFAVLLAWYNDKQAYSGSPDQCHGFI